MPCRRRLLRSGLTPICPEFPVAYRTSTMIWGMDTCSPDYWRSSVENCWWAIINSHPRANSNWLSLISLWRRIFSAVMHLVPVVLAAGTSIRNRHMQDEEFQKPGIRLTELESSIRQHGGVEAWYLRQRILEIISILMPDTRQRGKQTRRGGREGEELSTKGAWSRHVVFVFTSLTRTNGNDQLYLHVSLFHF